MGVRPTHDSAAALLAVAPAIARLFPFDRWSRRVVGRSSRIVVAMRLSTVILPIYRWAEGRKVWERAEHMGFHAAYTYDHLSWRIPFRDRTWFGAIPTLTAAAGATSTIRLGTMVTSVTG
jgi:hypothetical protein